MRHDGKFTRSLALWSFVVSGLEGRELHGLFGKEAHYMNLISIDPGASGGIAFQPERGDADTWKMPGSQPDVLNIIRAIKERCLSQSITCYIEDPPKYIGQNVPSSSIFVMAENYGYIKGVLQALGIRTIQVTPQTWMKALNLGKKGIMRAPLISTLEEKKAVQQHNAQAKRDWKNKLKAEAQRRYPDLAATLATADALLILDFAKIAENVREVEQATPFALKG